MSLNLKERKRSDYSYFLSYRTRWFVRPNPIVLHIYISTRIDNDQYGHINNSVYYHLFDSIVNAYLAEHCGQSPQKSELIGLVVESFSQVREEGNAILMYFLI
jgi:acyl-CoA thioester hydrolase